MRKSAEVLSRSLLCGVLGLMLVAGRPAHAQVIVGSIIDADTKVAVSGAVVTMMDSTGATLFEVRSDDAGEFAIDAGRQSLVQFLVRTVGLAPTRSKLVELPADADTVGIDLVAPRIGVTLATLRVVASTIKPNFNTYQLQDARRQGWRIIEPHLIAEDRDVVANLGDLIRRNPLPGVRPPNAATGCYRYTRSNRCLSLIVDGQVLGPDAFVSPGDVHFIAFVDANDAAVKYGARAREGAIFIATRRRGDNERKPSKDP